MVGARAACDASPPVATLIIGRGSKGLGVDLARGGGGSIHALHRYGAGGGDRSPTPPPHRHGRSRAL
jgi:hypothetical protein